MEPKKKREPQAKTYGVFSSVRLEQRLEGVIEKCERWSDGRKTDYIASFVVFCYFGFSYWTLNKHDFAEWTVYVVLLFGAPLLFQIFHVLLAPRPKKHGGPGDDDSLQHVSRGFYSIVGLIGTILLLLAWFCYLSVDEFEFLTNFALSILCLVFTVIGALVAIIVTWIIMRRPAPYRQKLKNIQKLRQGFARKPLSTVFFFLGLFLNVTYLLSFAFAFHNIDIYENSDGQKVALDAGPNVPVPDSTRIANIGDPKTWIIFFVERSSVVDDTVEPDEVRTLPDVLDHIERYIDNPERAKDFW